MKDQPGNESRDVDTADTSQPSFRKSRAGYYLIIALVTAGLLLVFENRADLFAGNWVIWLPLLICVGMHFFMHRGHGGHGSGKDKP